MKMSKSLKDFELPRDALAAVEDLRINLVNAVIEEYDNCLRKEGKCIDPRTKHRVHEQLMRNMVVKLDMSVQLTESVMEDAGVTPTDLRQAELQAFGV
ncbi:hypothetical protein [Methanococcoides sp. FTZ1]|uniref:hypothetical protein n=1 Tax=Methanococcoides sp. FTZ1 TaxID=3439061 RepID=UPI003F8545D0